MLIGGSPQVANKEAKTGDASFVRRTRTKTRTSVRKTPPSVRSCREKRPTSESNATSPRLVPGGTTFGAFFPARHNLSTNADETSRIVGGDAKFPLRCFDSLRLGSGQAKASRASETQVLECRPFALFGRLSIAEKDAGRPRFERERRRVSSSGAPACCYPQTLSAADMRHNRCRRRVALSALLACASTPP